MQLCALDNEALAKARLSRYPLLRRGFRERNHAWRRLGRWLLRHCEATSRLTFKPKLGKCRSNSGRIWPWVLGYNSSCLSIDLGFQLGRRELLWFLNRRHSTVKYSLKLVNLAKPFSNQCYRVVGYRDRLVLATMFPKLANVDSEALGSLVGIRIQQLPVVGIECSGCC